MNLPLIKESFSKHDLKWIFIASISLLLSCATTSQYSHYAYLQAVNLKVDSLDLIDKAVDDYLRYEKEVKQLKIQIEKVYEYEKGRPKNFETTKMWEILKDPDRDLLGGFLKLWEEKGKLSEAYVREKKKQISEAFDQIIGLESGKIKKANITQ